MANKKTTTEEVEAVELTAVETTTALVVPEVPKTAVYVVGDQEVNKALLLAQKEEVTALKIVDATDTQGYEKVRKANQLFRTTRTTIEKVRKQRAEPLQAFLKADKTNADELKAICQDTEDILGEKMKVIDDEKQRIKDEKEAEAARKVQERINKLVQLGAVFNAEQGTYSFPYDEVLFTSAVQVADFSDTEYNEFLQEVTESHQIELDRIEAERLAEVQRKADEEAEAERVRLQGIAQDAEKTKLQEKQVKLRAKELSLIGFVEENEVFTIAVGDNKPFVERAKLATMPDENWELFILGIEAALEAQAELDSLPKPDPELAMLKGDSFRVVPISSVSGFDFADEDDTITEVAYSEEPYIEQPQDEIDPFSRITLSLDIDTKFEDLDIAAKFFLRVSLEPVDASLFPDKAIISKGVFTSNGHLHWTLIKKA